MFPRPSPGRKALVKHMVLALALGLSAFWLLARRDAQPVKAQVQPPPFRNFEGPQVHPLAITPDGMRLLAVNTPNGTLSVFYLTGGGLTLVKEIPVGLEPVSVAARSEREAWVVNWLSDSVSVVDLGSGNVVRTIEVGDEPTDVLFAGSSREMAFVCVSGTSQVKVYDPNAPQTDPPQVLNIRGKQPRSLSRNAQGSQVFVSVFESGNQTTVVPFQQVRNAGGSPPPSPARSASLPAAPDTALIVKRSGSQWVDERGDGRWTQFVPYTLADVDVVTLDASGATAGVSGEVRGVGTLVGNSVVDPTTNSLLVVNTEAHNEVRFEPNLRGRFFSTRVAAVQLSGGGVTQSDLNPHINYNIAAGSDAERAQSLAIPADIARDAAGKLYVAATGSGRVGVLNSSGAVEARIQVGQGPTGLAVDNARGRLYVLNRFDQTLSLVNLSNLSVVGTTPIGNNPEPPAVRNGRRFLYDGSLSAHGDLACASCHANGHRDGIAWDLGDPQGSLQQVTSPVPGLPGVNIVSNFHPMKGPMTTQSLRGILGTEPLHWRGDRSNLAAFNPAFVSLLGGTRQLTPDEMAAFDAFVRTLAYPSNPLQNLDRTLPNPATGPNAQRGQQLFNTARTDGGALTCNQCHSVNRAGSGGFIIPAAALGETQDFKVPQLRGLYQKVGMARAPGEQLTGYGFVHDGTFDSLLSFLRSPVFTFASDNDRLDVAQFVMAFDTGTAPAVGSQVTANGVNKTSAAVSDRVNLLMAQSSAGNCDLVVNGNVAGVRRAFLYMNNGLFQPDRLSDLAVPLSTLMQGVDFNSELTFTGVPLGAGRRLSIDRDTDGLLNADEAPAPNPIDSAQFFISQQYADFLNRDPEPQGLSAWLGILTGCPQGSIACDRVEVSSAFFRSPEFHDRGLFVYKFYSAAFGRVPHYSEFMPDLRRVTGFQTEQQLEASKVAFINDFMSRAEFRTRYDSISDPASYVNAILSAAGVSLPSKDSLIADLSAGRKTRAEVLRAIADSPEVTTRYFNEAFVIMQYFGYLRRDADILYLNWIQTMNQNGGDYRVMINGFMNSAEYRNRFSQ